MPSLNNKETSNNFENLIPDENKVPINKFLNEKYYSNCSF